MARILLVDDDDLFRKMLRLTLVEIGYAVTEASNGKEALLAYERESVDAVMMDLIMPETEGLETIRALKKAHPKVKIIAMSGGGRGSAINVLNIAKVMGADRILSKPFPKDEMMTTLDELLGSAQP